MRAGRLRERITLEHKTGSTRDPMGGVVPTYAEPAYLWAEINPVSMRTLVADRRQSGEAALAMRVRAPLTVSLGDRIVHEDTNYEVIEIDTTFKSRGELSLMLKAKDTTA